MNPALTFKNNDQLNAEEMQQAERAEAQQRQLQPAVTYLSQHVTTCWEAAKQAKEIVQQIMLKSKRALNGEYEADKLAKIMAMGGSSIYMRLADEKSNAAKAWIIDTMLPADQMPFGVDPTPVPELTPMEEQAIRKSVMSETQMDIQMGVVTIPEDVTAKIEAIEGEIVRRMRNAAKKHDAAVDNKIKDVIVESNWKEAFKDFISNMVDYPAGIFKGPEFFRKKVITRDQAGNPKIESKIKMRFRAPSPFNIYPSPSATGPDDGFLFEKHTLTRKALNELRGAPQYDEAAINLVLEEYGRGGLRRWLWETNQQEVHRLAHRYNVDQDPDGTIDALQFWGSVQGIWLTEHGIHVDDVWAEYEVEVWQIGRYIIKAAINENPLGRRDYYVASFRETPGQFWGKGVPELIADDCDMCNAAARNLVNNMGIASGPQIGVDKSVIPAGEKLTTITPMKIWQFDMSKIANGTRPPMWFFQPQLIIEQLIKVYEFFSDRADNTTGIPKYSYGQQASGGALGTATGFSMMMSNASRAIKQVIGNIDTVIEGSIRGVRDTLVFYDPDPIMRKGDIKVVAKGAASLVAKEQRQIRMNEMLQIALHPIVLQTIGQDGFAELLRKVFQGADLDADDIVPSKDEQLRNRMLMQQQQPMRQQQGSANYKKGTNTNPAGDRMGGADVRSAA
jgi:hypothetical protein